MHKDSIIDYETGEIVSSVPEFDPTDKMALALIHDARTAIEQAKDIFEVKTIISVSKAASVFYAAQGLEENAQVAREASLRAQRKAGEFLQEMPMNAGTQGNFDGRDSSGGLMIKPPESIPTLADLDIDKNESFRWQLFAEVPEGTFQEYIDEKLAKGHELTAGGLINIAREQRKLRERERQLQDAIQAGAPHNADRYRLIHASVDRLAKILPVGSVDAIITDPPYEEEYLPVYADLARTAAKLLKPGAPLVAMIGHYHLPSILGLMAPYLNYLWIVAYITPANTARVFSTKALVNWKPVLVFSNGPYKGDWYADVLSNSAPDKRFHDWGQGESGMASLIERFTQPDQTVLDPFCGGSATGAAALKLDRYYIGADIDEYAVAVSAKRLSELES
jgi:hypothetical protein